MNGWLPGRLFPFTHFRSLGSAILLVFSLLVLLSASVGAWRLSLATERVQQETQIHSRLGDLNREIRTQIDQYFSLLRVGGATLSLLDQVRVEDWQQFSATLNLRQNYPNIESLHYLSYVPAAERDAFVEHMRQRGYPAFEIRGPGSSDFSCILTHSALDGGVSRGFDACQHPTPRRTLMAATEGPEPIISPRMSFTPPGQPSDWDEADRSPGFILVAPVFSLASTEQGRPSGWLAVVLISDEVFSPFWERLDGHGFRIVDFSDEEESTVMFEHGPEEIWNHQDALSEVQEMNIGERTWTLELSRPFQPSPMPMIILVAGVAISLLLFFLMLNSFSLRARAERLAVEMTRAYRESEQRRARTEEISLVMVAHLDLEGYWIKLPPRLCERLDRSEGELLEKPVSAFMEAADIQRFESACAGLVEQEDATVKLELRLLTARREPVWTEMNMSVVRSDAGDPLYYLVFLQDVGDRKVWEQELKSRDRLLQAISSSLNDLIAPGDFAQSINQVLQTIGSATEVDRAYIFTNHPHSETGLPAHSMKFEWVREGVSAELDNPQMKDLPYAEFPEFWYDRLQAGKAVTARPRDLSAKAREILESQDIRSLLLMPILMRGGFFGFIGLDDCRSERSWPDSQITALLAAAASIGNAFERQETEEALEHNRRLLSSITDNISEGIYRSTPAGQLEYVNNALASMFGYESPDDMLRIPAPIHYVSPSRREDLKALVEKQGFYRDEEVEFLRRDGSRFVALNSAVAMHDSVDNVTYLDGVISDITERKNAEKKIHYLAHYDTLTGLPNRSLLRDRMENAIARARRDGKQLAVLFIDLDRFKNVNDSLGHAVGDRLLEEVAKRLKHETREEDTVSRQGGDEFIVMLASIEEANQAANVAQKLLTSLGRPYRIGNHELHVTPSIGISLFPGDADDMEELVRNADAAMYQAKERGRYNFQFFTHDLSIQAWERLSLENQLRKAIQRKEFVLHYQPQLSLETGEIVGVEALVRWRHEGRLISPGVFIPVAEQTGMIIEIGDWVLHEACQQARSWQDEGLVPLPVSVNLSPLQFRRRDIRSHVQEALASTGLAPEFLELELTESTVMEEVEESVRMLGQLSRLGVGLCVDDFGTGYSSLSYLKRFPIDKLKIDQSFVSDIPDDSDDAAITGAVIDMGHNLNLRICAEGVETREQLRFLRDRGCQEMQGFLFSRPLPAEKMAELLRNRTRMDVAS